MGEFIMFTTNCIGIGFFIAGFAMIHISLGFILFGLLLAINTHEKK